MIRYRVESEPGPLGTMTHTSNTASIAPPLTARNSLLERSMEDIVTPDFRNRMKRGDVIINPCSRVTTFYHSTCGGRYEARRLSNPGLYSIASGNGSLTNYYKSALFASYKSMTPKSLESLSQLVQTRALAAINRAPYAVAEDLATIGQTIQFVRNPLKSLFKLVKSFDKDVRRRKHLPRSKAISEVYLTYRFAFQPLVRSAHSVIESLGRQKSRSRRETSHSTERWSDRSSDKQFIGQFTFDRFCSYERSVRAVILYSTESPLSGWRRAYGLRSQDIPELLWDLFPLSFMIDRLIDVGSGIRALTNLSDPGVKILGATVSYSDTIHQTLSLVNQVSPGWSVNITPDIDTLHTEVYHRQEWLPQWSDAVPRITLGGLAKDLTSIADLTSLIVQRLR